MSLCTVLNALRQVFVILSIFMMIYESTYLLFYIWMSLSYLVVLRYAVMSLLFSDHERFGGLLNNRIKEPWTMIYHVPFYDGQYNMPG